MFVSHSVTILAATGTPASASQGYRGGPARLRPGCARDRGHRRREEGPPRSPTPPSCGPFTRGHVTGAAGCRKAGCMLVIPWREAAR